MKLTPAWLKRLLNIYPPYLGAGIKIEYISQDWKELHVAMSLRWYNRNYVRSQFGGSLYSMIDPHFMLLLMQILGKDYVVWDKSASIDFVKPGRSKVSAVIKISDEAVADIKRQTESGEKYLPVFPYEIHDMDGELVARGEKVIYVRKKQATSA